MYIYILYITIFYKYILNIPYIIYDIYIYIYLYIYNVI